MSIFNVISLLGGLAMFLYGMKIMSAGLQGSSSGTLKNIMEKVTGNIFKAFILGVAVTAIIQSSTATIVITSGLVAAGIISLRQSLGIIVGANVGTTVTGQIIRLLDIQDGATQWLQIFKPSTLAPVALIAGIIFIMFLKKVKNSDQIGTILMGFGILFTGLMGMTSAVDVLSETGAFNVFLENMSDSPLIGYTIGAVVSFILQSSSASVGILQAFSVTGLLSFKGIYAVLLGIYLGDCVTTAIVCCIGAKPDAKRVGYVHVIFNIGKTILVFVVVTILHSVGVLDGLWNSSLTSGGIANINSLFNIISAIAMFPFLIPFEKMSGKLVKKEPVQVGKYDEKLAELDPKFFNTPAISLNSCYDVLRTMFESADENIRKSFKLLFNYDEKLFKEIEAEEEHIDVFADRVTAYLVQLAPHLTTNQQLAIHNQYYKVITEFERLGDHAMNIAEVAKEMHESKNRFSDIAYKELRILEELIRKVIDSARMAFEKADLASAAKIEPLEEVVDDMVNALHENHQERLMKGSCGIVADSIHTNLLADIERISDICSNIGIAVVARNKPELADQAHAYVSLLHQGEDENFNKLYTEAHDFYFDKLNELGEWVDFSKRKSADE